MSFARQEANACLQCGDLSAISSSKTCALKNRQGIFLVFLFSADRIAIRNTQGLPVCPKGIFESRFRESCRSWPCISEHQPEVVEIRGSRKIQVQCPNTKTELAVDACFQFQKLRLKSAWTRAPACEVAEGLQLSQCQTVRSQNRKGSVSSAVWICSLGRTKSPSCTWVRSGKH